MRKLFGSCPEGVHKTGRRPSWQVEWRRQPIRIPERLSSRAATKYPQVFYAFIETPAMEPRSKKSEKNPIGRQRLRLACVETLAGLSSKSIHDRKRFGV